MESHGTGIVRATPCAPDFVNVDVAAARLARLNTKKYYGAANRVWSKVLVNTKKRKNTKDCITSQRKPTRLALERTSGSCKRPKIDCAEPQTRAKGAALPCKSLSRQPDFDPSLHPPLSKRPNLAVCHTARESKYGDGA